MLVTLLPWGLLADRLSERIVIALGLVGAAGALLAAGWTHSYGALLLTLFVAGAFGASVNAASGRAVMGWFPANERGLALGVRQTALPIGGASPRQRCRGSPAPAARSSPSSSWAARASRGQSSRASSCATRPHEAPRSAT
jgi:sugar phosphate permease